MANWNPPSFGPQQPGVQPPMAPQQPGVQQPGPQLPPQAQSDDFSDLDPIQLARLADLYGGDLRTAAVALRMKRAEALAGTPMPQGREVGGVYRASNPLEFAGAAMMRYQGLKGMKQSEDQMRKLGNRTARDAYSQYRLYGAPDTDETDENLRF